MRYWNSQGGKNSPTVFPKALTPRPRRKKKKRSEQTPKQLERILQQEHVKIEDWLAQNVQSIKKDKLISLHRRIARRARDQLLQLAIQGLGVTEGVHNANSALKQELGMSEAGFNFEEIARLMADSVRVQVCQLIIGNSNLSPELQDEILQRYLARLFPMRDNLPEPLNSPLLKQVQEQLSSLRRSVDK